MLERLLFLIPALLVFFVVAGLRADDATTKKARQFLSDHDKRIRPLEVAKNLAWWKASTTGKDEDIKNKEVLENKYDAALAEPGPFAELKDLKNKRKEIDDPLLIRALDLLYLQYLEKQVDPKLLRDMVAKANAVESAFNRFRAQVDKEELPDNKVREILRTSNDSKRLREVWQASKKVGEVVEADLKELVKLRNQAAKQLGFANFHSLQLHLNEQEGKDLLELFDELDRLTAEPFTRAKEDIDARLAKRYGVKHNELMPWHYHDPFFQDTPRVFDTDLDGPFRKADILRLCRLFYDGIGLPVDRVLAVSDLEPRPRKSQHAFCTDIDREGDVRVLANIVPDFYWAATMLHELGHAVYSTHNGNIPARLPYVLRGEAHILTTEGIAMMFERLASRSDFLTRMGVALPDARGYEESASRSLRYRLLIFSRWCQVMLRFEKAMYEDPSRDLNQLWWDLVERYQGLRRPPGRNAPDYASKIHIIVAPVYYHNYMMGELFASQLHHAIAREVFKEANPNKVIYAGNKEVGTFLRDKVFAPGRTLPWNQLTRIATGAPLSPRAFAADFQAR